MTHLTRATPLIFDSKAVRNFKCSYAYVVFALGSDRNTIHNYAGEWDAELSAEYLGLPTARNVLMIVH